MAPSSTWPWIGSSLGLLLVAGLVGAWIAIESRRNLRYGQFKQKLVKGEIRAAPVGPTETPAS